jgi:hypothetical protein
MLCQINVHENRQSAQNSGGIDRWLNLNTIHFSTASSGIWGLLFAWIPGSTIGGIRFRHVELKKVLRAQKTLEF